jgi:hypothetical protein
MPDVQWESRGLYCLAPESACSRGIQAGCERMLSPRSRLRKWRDAPYPESPFSTWVKCVLLDELCLCVALLCYTCALCLIWSKGCPASPFIAARGGRAFTCVSLRVIFSVRWSDSADPVKIDRLVLVVWATAWWSLLAASTSPVWIVEVGSEVLWLVLQ